MKRSSVTGNGTAVPVIHPITPAFLAQQKLASQAQSADLTPFIKPAEPYRIGSGDVLSVIVWDHPQLNLPSVGLASATAGESVYPVQSGEGYAVDHEGVIQFPALGPIKLAGLTELEARNLLVKRLDKVVKEPKVTLRIRDYRSKRIYVEGEVKTPGTQTLSNVPMTLMESIGRAGGFLPTADQSRVTVIRDGISYPVNFATLARAGIAPTKIMLATDDVVRVRSAEENKVYVMGEVLTPKALPMTNGALTLNDALGEAGGPNPSTSDTRAIYVIRNTGGPQPTVYNLDADSPSALALAAQFELQAKDVVFVDTTSLVNFSRIIGSLLPSAGTAATLTNVAR